MMKKEEKLSIYRQSVLLGVNHTSYYYRAVEKKDDYSGVRYAIIDIWNDSPARGARHIRNELRKRGYFVSRKKVGGLMKELKIKAVMYKRNLSKPNKKHKKYPYLLRGVKIVRPNQVWSTDISYIRLPHGFADRVAIMVVVERLWRNVKPEDVYLKGYATIGELMVGLTEHFLFYNGRRPP